ncbi:MAG TPA: DUF4230 domain-containing protein [Gemmatimonadales bacterium]|nr:DUF4230 domain-containing protein [Gemmatimonadales bacterium]
MKRLAWVLVLSGAVLIVALAQRCAGAGRSLLGGRQRSTMTHSLVVERMRAVARLVTSETMVRDVVVYENRRLGSTKRSLVVVTGRVTAGIRLEPPPEIRIDEARQRVEIALPRAEVMGVEITELRTYDERSGLWNPFRPADRDTIFHEAREQLVRSAEELGLAGHAERSARTLIEALVGAQGWTAEVSFAPGVAVPPPD